MNTVPASAAGPAETAAAGEMAPAEDMDDVDSGPVAPGDPGEGVQTETPVSRGVIDPVRELLEAGITDEMARATTGELRSGLLAAADEETVERQHDKAREVIGSFRETPFGKKAYEWIHLRGYMIIPLFSSDEPEDKTRAMTEKIHQEYLHEMPDGRLEVPRKMKLATINSQKRWMIDLEKPRHQRKLGRGFVEDAEAAAQMMAFALQALSYGCHEKVDVEKLTLLLSAAGEGSQVLHKDQDGRDVLDKLQGQGSRARGRGSPPPYSGVCAFRDPAFLHVIEGSHKDFLRDNFDWADAREVIVPRGYGLLFHSCLMHAGCSYEVVNGRLHLCFKCVTGTQTADGTFKQVKQTGVPPSPKKERS